MNILQLLNCFDTNLFLLINGFHSVFFDGFMYAISAKLTWIPLYIAILYVVIKRWKSKSFWIIIALVLCVVIADHISSGLIKNLVQRLRPSQTENLKDLVHLVRNSKGGGLYGFVSSHAANTLGLALLSTLIFRKKSFAIAVFSWSALNGYSRVYLGAHYPFDVLGGFVVGSSTALLIYWLLKKIKPAILKPVNEPEKEIETQIPEIVFGLTLISIVIYSIFIF